MKNKQPFSKTHPDLAAEAVGLDASAVTAGSNTVAKWRCSSGHIWETAIKNRTRGSGCPYCAGKAVLVGFNDLATTHPDLAEQANGWDPKTLSAGSNKVREWTCRFGHSWSTPIAERALRPGNCPVCSGKVVLIGFNDLATTHPELAAQADGWDPTTVTAGSGKRLLWKCPEGHEWVASVGHRSSGTGCPACSGNSVLKGFNDLATTHPEIATQADGWDPTTVIAGSSRREKWKCAVGHLWEIPVSSRTGPRSAGCPFCANKAVLPGFNDLATTHPEIATQADGWDPTTVTAGSHHKRGWICEQGHRWTAQVGQRSRLESGCPYCSGMRPIVGFNDLATVRPELAAQADGWDPTTVTASSNHKRGWICEQGHRWTAVVASRNSGRSCPFCANKAVLPGFNDLATVRPELAAQADGWDPTTVTAGSGAKKLWKCHLGHTWSASPHNRGSEGVDLGCPYCAGKAVLVGFNDLATTRPEIASEADGWDPTTVTAGSNVKRRWQCTEGHSWTAQVGNRGLRGSGCPSCAQFGFDPNKPAWIYLLCRDHDELLQIGITNDPERRLKKHSRGNWYALDLVGPIDGHTAREVEQAFLKHLDSCSIPRASAFSDPFDGYTEAWRREDLDISMISEIQNLVRKWEDKRDH